MWLVLVSGSGMSAGPGVDRSRFVACPFRVSGPDVSHGDVVRWNPAGSWSMGRADEQVKIRGYRIELGGSGRVGRAGGVAAAAVIAP